MDEREIRRLLGGPRYERLFAVVRRALEERGESARAVGLKSLDAAEREAVADLLGLPTVPAATSRLQLRKLDDVLRESRLGVGLVEVVEALGGPLVDRRAQRAAAREARRAMWKAAGDHETVGARPVLRAWLDGLRRSGALSRAATASGDDASEVLQVALSVLSRLPARGLLRQELASEARGDPHALDDDRPLTGIVLGGVAALAGWPETPRSAPARRRLWAEVGVLCDPLSSHVLVLGLRPSGEGRLARNLRGAAAEGEPVRVTLRELERGVPLFGGRPPPGPPERDEKSRRTGAASPEPERGAGAPRASLFVCENPAVVLAAAERLGARCAPLLCTEGVPSTAALRLLSSSRDAGLRIRAHADFDWGGVEIVSQLVGLIGAEPWGFGAGDYRAAARVNPSTVSLRGRRVATPWDPDLAAAMADEGVAVFEEQQLEELLADLDRG